MQKAGSKETTRTGSKPITSQLNLNTFEKKKPPESPRFRPELTNYFRPAIDVVLVE